MKTFSMPFNSVRAALLLAMCLMASSAHAAVDAFIWFESVLPALPIEGETMDEVFKSKKAFKINDFSFGVDSPTTLGSATGGAGAGKIKFNEFTIRKTTDKASPAFFKNCAVGAHYEKAFIAIRRAGGDARANFLFFEFDTVFTTKINWSGPGDVGPEESITFVFAKFGLTYFPQKADGTLDSPVSQGWDQIQSVNFLPDTNPLN